LSREITQLEIEEAALKKEKNKEHLEQVQKNLADKTRNFKELKAKWQYQRG